MILHVCLSFLVLHGGVLTSAPQIHRFKPDAGVQTYAVREPVLRIQPGDILETNTLYSDFFTAQDGPWPGEVGPIYVEGATPDDTLVVKIIKIRPNIATGFELEVITIVILGGVLIGGGTGKFWGVMLSVFLVGTIRYGIGLHNVNAQYMFLIIGGLLIVSILINNLTAWITSQRELSKSCPMRS